MTLFRAAILTAKEIEFDAVREHLVEEQRVDDTFDGTVYRRAKIRRELSSDTPIDHWEVAIYRTGRGQQPTTYGTQILMQHFRPDIVLYVGVAGGDPSHAELTVGDVVVGKLVRYYERTSQHADSFTIKDEYHSPNRALISAAEYEADEANWFKRIHGERPNSQVFVEEIASGEKVQKSASSPLWSAIKARYPDVIAVETEGQGFHYAVSQSAGRGLMVRSISDLLDNKDDDSGEHGTDDDRQALASKHAAAFAINLIANLNTKFLEDIRPSATFRYAVIIKISADTIEGVHRATRLFADAINDPHLTVESLQPANSFLLRIHTTLHSAAYARAVFKGGFVSELLGAEVSALESDVERTGESIFDSFLLAVSSGNAHEIISTESRLLDTYPSWRSAAFILERLIVSRNVRKADPPVSPAEQSKGKHIREQRETLGLSMKELAYDAGISSSFLSAIETGKKNPSAGAWRSLQESLQRRSGRNESIGERLIAFRRRANLTQEQISKSAGISRSTLAAIERGRQPSKMTEIALEQTIRDLALKYKIFFNR